MSVLVCVDHVGVHCKAAALDIIGFKVTNGEELIGGSRIIDNSSSAIRYASIRVSFSSAWIACD